MKKNYKYLEERILILRKRHSSLSIREILDILSGTGRPLLLILLSLPFCQPLQIPGLSLPFGLAIAFIGLRMAFGKNVWFPKFILVKRVPQRTLEKLSTNVLKIIRKMKWWTRPRLEWMCHSYMRIINSLMILLLGALLAMPLPIPASNLIAAWAIFFMAVGLLEDDGLFVLIGYVIFFLTLVAIFTTIFLILHKH